MAGIVDDIWNNQWFRLFSVVVLLLSAFRLILAVLAAVGIGIGILAKFA
jgi:hypothetical protein